MFTLRKKLTNLITPLQKTLMTSSKALPISFKPNSKAHLPISFKPNSKALPISFKSTTHLPAKYTFSKSVTIRCLNTEATPGSSNGDLNKRIFGDFIARKAILDDDYLMVAKLRAEGLWESMGPKPKLVDMEYKALKKECTRQDFYCLIALKKDIVVGALDLIIDLNWLREIRQGDEILSDMDILEDHKPLDSYMTNIVVAEESRRLGIASNLIQYAIDIATFKGMDKIFLHVAKENKSASECYKKRGFKFVAANTPSVDGFLLMWKDL